MSRAEQFAPFGAGALTALLHMCVVLVPPVGMLLAYFALAPLATVGFSLGFMPAAVASAVAALIIGMASFGSGALTVFLATSAGPLLAVVYLVSRARGAASGQRSRSSVDDVFSFLALLTLCYFLVATLLFAARDGGLQGAISGYLLSLFGDIHGLPSGVRNAAIETTALYFPGIALFSWLMMVIVNCTLAQKLATRWGRNMWPTPAYSMVEAPLWPLAVLVCGVMMSFLEGQLRFYGVNLIIISGIPFVLNGYGLLHAVSRTWPFRRLILCVIYLISAAQLWPVAGFGLLGIVETRLRFRARLSTRNTGST